VNDSDAVDEAEASNEYEAARRAQALVDVDEMVEQMGQFRVNVGGEWQPVGDVVAEQFAASIGEWKPRLFEWYAPSRKTQMNFIVIDQVVAVDYRNDQELHVELSSGRVVSTSDRKVIDRFWAEWEVDS
jgi:hypothetical protein